MRFIILQFSVLSSGSKGNALFIQSQNACILIDAGLSLRELTARLTAIGRSPGNLDALLLTHEHSDHLRGVGPLSRRHHVPIYSTEGTWLGSKQSVGNVFDWRFFLPNDSFWIQDIEIEAYPTPHDAEESVAFVVRQGENKIGHATDLGVVTPAIVEKLRGVDVLLVEANHDETLLDAGPYPWSLKQRIKSDLGHLSNQACADLLTKVKHKNLQTVILMHLSETNNHKSIARLTAEQALQDSHAKILLAEQDQPTQLLTIQ